MVVLTYFIAFSFLRDYDMEVIDIFVTDMCNASCPYCFVKKGNYQITEQEISDIKKYLSGKKNIQVVNILGGEPTISKNLINLIQMLKDIDIRNIRLYSNGYDVAMLQHLHKNGVDVVINYDAYTNDIDDILSFRWNYTIAPSTLSKLNDVAETFVENKKELDFGILRYRGGDFWSPDTLVSLEKSIQKLYLWYEEKLIKKRQNFMPDILRRSLIQLIALSRGINIGRDCSHKTTFVRGNRQMCYAMKGMVPLSQKCLKCCYGTVCDYRKACYVDYDDDIMCNVENIMMKQAQLLNHRLLNNSIWQYVIMSLSEGENGTNR